MATRRFTLYGSSPDQLAAQQYRYDAMGLGAAESNRAAAMNAQAQSIANAERVRQEDEAAMVRDRNERLAYLKLFADEAATRRGMMEDSRRFDASMGLSERQLAAQIARDRLTNEGRGVSLRKAYFDEAIQSASTGIYPTLESVKVQNPTITDDEAIQVFAVSQAARQQAENAMSPFRSAAQTLNNSRKASERVALLDETLKTIPPRNPRNLLPTSFGDALSRATPPGAIYSSYKMLFPGTNPEYTTALSERDAAIKTSTRLKSLADEVERNKPVMSELVPDERGEYRAPLLPWETRNRIAPRGASPAAAPPNPEAILAEANDAIKRGADPVKVRERLAQMGITLQ